MGERRQSILWLVRALSAPRLCDDDLPRLLLAREAVSPMGDASGSEPGAPGSGHWPATFLSQLFPSACCSFLIG